MRVTVQIKTILASVPAEHNSRRFSAEGWCHRVMVYLLVPYFFDRSCKPGREKQERGQKPELRRCHTNQDTVLMQCSTNQSWVTEACTSSQGSGLDQCGLADDIHHKSPTEGKHFSICLGLGHCGLPQDGSKNSLGLGYITSIGVACHHGYSLRLKCSTSDGGANLHALDSRAGRTGLNLHHILIILFSTNKLTPEKT